MRPEVKLADTGAIDYKECWELQKELFAELVKEKELGTTSPHRCGWLILCEHPHVYTLGKSGHSENLLVSEDFLRGLGAALYRTDRGGDITYHGPGQIVGYPILDLEKTGMGLREYISALEQSVIDAVARFGIEAERIDGKTGVWISDSRGERKICAIGVKSSRFITMHGFALNVGTDLRYFGYINPCGFAGGGVTSIDAETGSEVSPEKVKRTLCETLSNNMGFDIVKGQLPLVNCEKL